MAQGSSDPTRLIAEELRKLFKSDVEAPLPPLLLQLLRQLHESTEEPEGDEALSESPRRERPRPKRADLFLPGARSQWWRSY